MNVVESVRMSARAIRGHPLRSLLTTLGVVIGVAAVITFVTLGTSVEAAIVGDIAGQARPEMTATAAPPGDGPGGGPAGAGSVPVFTEHDVAELRALPDVAAVVPTGTVQTAAVARDGQRVAWEAAVATTPAAFEGRTFVAGRPFRQGERAVVVNEQAAALFAPNLSVGDRLVVHLAGGSAVNATVVGVLNVTDAGGFGAGATPQFYVPTDPFYGTTVESPSTGADQRVYPAVTIRATDFEHVSAVEADAEAYLNGSSDAARLAPPAYEVVVQTNEQLVEQIRDVLDTFTGFITGIAVISLVVGAIGIANIMLVSVTERTREIGIMKAVGARSLDVLQLFLVEAVVLGVVGAVLGTGVGVVGGYAATDYVDVRPVFRPEWFAVAVAVGIGVGVVAGLYPAWNAARVDPIDALRRE